MPVERPDWTGSEGAVVPAEPQQPAGDDGSADAFADQQTAVPSSGATDAAEKAWAETGGIEFHRQIGMAAVQGVLDRLAPEDAQELEQSVDGVPTELQTAIKAELGLGPVGSVRSATAAQVQAFAAFHPELVRRWGGQAGRNLGRIMARTGRIEASFSPGARDAFGDWLDGLPTPTASAILDAIARG